jgi:hypothetical protein
VPVVVLTLAVPFVATALLGWSGRVHAGACAIACDAGGGSDRHRHPDRTHYHRRRRQAALGRFTPVEFEIIMSTVADQAA